MKPTCKIEVYNVAGDAVYTDITDAVAAETVKHLTGQAGSFSFTLPAYHGATPAYTDIADHYKVKIYLGYGTLTASDLQLTGRIQNHTGVLQAVNGGNVRVFVGKDQAEVLDRRHKTNKQYLNVAAYDIVDDLIGELTADTGLTLDADSESETEKITIRTESYLDVLRRVSDYWVNSGTQIKKDFYVTDDLNTFVWKNRPLRTVGVESLEVGINLLDYNLFSDVLPVKNRITVYGAASASLPNDKDFWTENADDLANNWTLTTGTSLTLSDIYTPKEGSSHLLCQASDVSAPYEQEFQFSRTLPKLTLRTINQLGFWYYPNHNISGGAYTSLVVRLLAPDSSNYFETRDLAEANCPLSDLAQWSFARLNLGEEQEYDADENTTGIWDKVGSPNWWALEGIEFAGVSNGAASGSLLFAVDKLRFSPDRWTFTADATASQTAYGIREAEYTDDNLTSQGECEVRAYTLLYQQKDPPRRLDVHLNGNTNIKIGDRIPFTSAAEGYSAVDFDVLTVRQNYAKGGGLNTFASLVYGGDTRRLPPVSPLESTIKQLDGLKSVAADLYSRIVK